MELEFNPEHLFKNYAPDESWFTETSIPRAVEYFLWEFSNLNAPRDLFARLNPEWEAHYRQLFQTSPARRVLMLGTGFGSLALLAAAAGKDVYACDRFPALARVSKQVIESQSEGLPGKIVTFFKDLKELKLGEDIPEACDLFVFDDFDHTLLETGLGPLLEHCRRDLLTPEAQIAPARARISARLVELVIDDSYFDLSALGEHQWGISSHSFDPQATKHRWLSEPAEVFTLDFTSPLERQRFKIPFSITADGHWNAICFWHELFGVPCYQIQYIDSVLVSPGQEYNVTAYQLRTKIRFEPAGGVEKIRRRGLQSWHVDMVNDQVRNDAYARSIEAVVSARGNCRVLDIGSGSGLLSLMAARANPECRVAGCEILEELGQTAGQIARVNGLQERVQFFHSDIRQLQLPEKADVIVHEVVASGMLGEGVLHFLNHALANLAAPGVTVLPRAAHVQGMLIAHRLDSLLGFDVSAANAYRWHPDYSSLELNATAHLALSRPFDVFSFDFTQAQLKGEQREVEIPLTAAGLMNAVVYWFELEMDENHRLSSSPFSAKTCWNQAIQYLQPVQVEEGRVLPLKLEHDCYKISFSIMEDKLGEGTTLSAQPAYDKAWAARFTEIEKQYQQMILKATSIEQTFAVLVEAAVKIASDAGAFGVRSKFASRLAESFFIH